MGTRLWFFKWLYVGFTTLISIEKKYVAFVLLKNVSSLTATPKNVLQKSYIDLDFCFLRKKYFWKSFYKKTLLVRVSYLKRFECIHIWVGNIWFFY